MVIWLTSLLSMIVLLLILKALGINPLKGLLIILLAMFFLQNLFVYPTCTTIWIKTSNPNHPNGTTKDISIPPSIVSRPKTSSSRLKTTSESGGGWSMAHKQQILSSTFKEMQEVGHLICRSWLARLFHQIFIPAHQLRRPCRGLQRIFRQLRESLWRRSPARCKGHLKLCSKLSTIWEAEGP